MRYVLMDLDGDHDMETGGRAYNTHFADVNSIAANHNYIFS